MGLGLVSNEALELLLENGRELTRDTEKEV